MKYARWAFLFAAIAAVYACKPFVAPKRDDGGIGAVADAGSAGAAGTSSPSDAMDLVDTSRTDAAADLSASVDVETEISDSRSEQTSDVAAPEHSDVGTTDANGVEAGCDATGSCKKPDGELCLADSECSTGTCGGRCCAAGCTCSQPSIANLLKNPSVDRDTFAWAITGGTLAYSLSDAERCPYSGSLMVVLPAMADEVTISQCVRSVPLKGDFNFGARVQTTGGSSAKVIACQLAVYSGFNCDADLTNMNESDASRPNFGWDHLDASLAMISGANSFTFSCFLAADPAVETTFYIDMLYVTRTPGHY
jgi:hypothetical protein